MKKGIIALLLGVVFFSTSHVAIASEIELDSQNSVSLDSQKGPGFYDNSYRIVKRSIETNPPQFLSEIKKGAQDGWVKYKVLPSITGAQAALESGWGTSKLAQLANNLFGIKGTYQGQYVIMPTKEYINGQWVIVEAKFRKYPSKNESMIDHGEFLQKPRYENIIGVTDYKKVAHLLQEDGYATDPNYANKLISIIEKWGLADWDKEILNQN